MNNMNTIEFLNYLRRLKINLSLKDNRLLCKAPPKVLTPDLQAQIKAYKPEIIAILKQSQNESSLKIESIPRNQELPLSFAQERLWFLTKLDENSPVYNIIAALKIQGNLNLKALEKSIASLFQRHEILRSNFRSTEAKPYLVINPEVNSALNIVNLEKYTPIEQKKAIETIIKQKDQQIFDLEKDTLLQFTLLRLSPQEYILIILIHHIISDGWSMGILTQELSHLYQAYKKNTNPSLPSLSIQYVDYAAWQRKYLTAETIENKISYWQEKLKDTPSLSTFPTDFPRPPFQTFTGAEYRQLLNKNLYSELQKLSHTEGVTLFITLLTAFTILLYRHTRQEKLTIGFPIAGRNNLVTENLIGFFANTLLVNSDLGGNPTFQELLEQVKKSVFKAYEHQDLPFEKLVQEIQPERNLSHNPLFQIWFNMVNLEYYSLELTDLDLEYLVNNNKDVNSKFDLTIYARELDESLELSWVYNQDLYQEKTINWIAQQYQTLLEEITINPQQKIHNISLLKTSQFQELFNAKNVVNYDNSWVKFSASEIEQSIIERLEKQVKLFPKKIAIKTKNKQWNYKQLNQKINQIAAQILSLSTSKTEQIALLFEHEAEMIAALLAVLKTGKIYVPLDATYPEARLNYILEDSQASLLLTNTINYDLANKLNLQQRVIVNVDEILSENSDHNSHHFSELTPETVAYILYTSGSTGKPKGVIQTHRNVLHFIRNYTNSLKISPEDRISLLASISFDAAVIDIFGALLNGATLCLYDVKREDLSLLPQWLESEKITIYHSTPTLYRYLIKEISTFNVNQQNLFPDLRLVVLGGEEVVKTDVEAYRKYFGENCLLINGYGCTESSFNSKYLINKQTNITNPKVSIGYPLGETEILLLDEEGNNTQICGEIAIKSEYVAKGYWRQPELTKKVFLRDSQDIQKRIYHTGDWGRLRSDGTIEFLGRKDFQIKIRGIRVELGEIETNLNQHPQLKETVVIAKENQQGDKYLAAYLVSNQGQNVDIKQLRKFLAQKLPEYMIPNVFVALDAFPLTPNGKINRQALPEIDFSTSIEEEFIAPRNETEIKLAQIWQEILGREKIGIHDNFFALGGHSLLATQVISRLVNTFEIELPLRYLFESPTIETLSDRIENRLWFKSKSMLSEDDIESGEL